MNILVDDSKQSEGYFYPKQVLKCLRLSADPITLKLKRDPGIKARVRHYLSTPQHLDEDLTEFITREQTDSQCNSVEPHQGNLSPDSNGRDDTPRNGTCSELEALIPPTDSFEEADRYTYTCFISGGGQTGIPTPASSQ
ncbi:unnamed protein product, partial [Timema podura]|nr:unnamed protein product [Timema podura]